MGPNTYGKNKIDVNLSDIVSQKSKKDRSKVCRFFCNYNKGVTEIKKIENDYFKKRLLTIWKNEKLRNLEKLQIEDEIKSFMRCSIFAKYRSTIREI